MQRRGRGRPSNAEREARRQFEERQLMQVHPAPQSRRRVIHDEEDFPMADAAGDSRQRTTRLRQNANPRGEGRSDRSRSYLESIVPSNGASTRRNARRIVDSSHEQEEHKGESMEEKTHNKIIRETGYFMSDREEVSAFNFDKMIGHDDTREKGCKPMT